MATQIQYRHSNSSDTLYMVVIHDSDGAHVVASSGAHDATPTSGEWGNYDVSMSEDSNSQLYQGTFPAGTAAGFYTVHIFSGSSAAVGDVEVGITDSFHWDGTNITQNASSLGEGAGGITFTYTLTESGSGDPIANANVWVTSDIAGSNIIASGVTNDSGVVVFTLFAGTIYVWRNKSGFDFTNPDTEVVA
jgi:hypothetical protein